MTYKLQSQLQLSSKDLLSYVFDEPTYNQDEPIFIDAHNPSHSISYNQARGKVRRLIKGLRKTGLQNGDCVAVHSFNNIHYSVLVLAVIGCGGIFTGTNPTYTSTELRHHLETSQARFVFTESTAAVSNHLVDSIKGTNIPQKNIWTFGANASSNSDREILSWETLMDHGEEDWVRFNDLGAAQSTVAARFFSSGTTGLPKAVDITHHNLLAQHALVFEAHPRPYRITSLIALPVFHAAIAPLVHIGTIRSGYIAYIMRRFDLTEYLKLIGQYNITDLIVVPPIIGAILTYKNLGKDSSLRKLKSVVCGAAPLSKDLQSQFRGLLSDGVPVTQGWGMTETCCASTMFPYPELDESGSVGRLIPNVEAKLIDSNLTTISTPGSAGELCIRGPTVTPGYFNNPSANAAAFLPGSWLRTGDIARCDPDTQKWYIVGREKELIKVRGFQVAPSELEAILHSHPGVADAAVVGVTSTSSATEAPRAFVVRRTGSSVSAVEILQYTERHLARYKWLTGGVRFVNGIPRNASGKILRRALLETDGDDVDMVQDVKSKL